MAHHLIDQLRFTRAEWQRALAGVTAAEGQRRLAPMNSIGWIVGHLAWQEQAYWLWWRGQPLLDSSLNELVGFGRPASTPPLAQMMRSWQTITATADPYLTSLATPQLTQFYERDGQTARENVGTMVLRMTYHYWFHMGEIMAIRQSLGHTDLPQFVGPIGRDAPYSAT